MTEPFVGEIQLFGINCSARISIAAISGSSEAPNRAARLIRAYLPASALTQVSKEGVAEANTTCAEAKDARSTAISRAEYITPSSCL